MTNEEGRPSREEVSAQHSDRSTFQASTSREFAHRPSRPLIACEPCSCCDDAAREAETGAGFCRATPGAYECETYLACRRIAEVARIAAEQIARIEGAEMRREIAEAAGDGFANALSVQGRGAEFDAEAFLELCGCDVAVAA